MTVFEDWLKDHPCPLFALGNVRAAFTDGHLSGMEKDKALRRHVKTLLDYCDNGDIVTGPFCNQVVSDGIKATIENIRKAMEEDDE